MIASLVARFLPVTSPEIESERPSPEARLPRWLYLWNGFLVGLAVVLLVIDQKGVFGDASKWFFSALIFASLKALVRYVVS